MRGPAWAWARRLAALAVLAVVVARLGTGPFLAGLRAVSVPSMLAAAAIGYLCKHNATLSGAEGGCQAEIGVASAMGAALISQAHDFDHQVVANAAEAALQHHLGMTCDPVAGFGDRHLMRALQKCVVECTARVPDDGVQRGGQAEMAERAARPHHPERLEHARRRGACRNGSGAVGHAARRLVDRQPDEERDENPRQPHEHEGRAPAECLDALPGDVVADGGAESCGALGCCAGTSDGKTTPTSRTIAASMNRKFMTIARGLLTARAPSRSTRIR